MAGIDTAATEQILEQLLKESRNQGRAQTSFISALAKKSGVDPKLIADQENRLKSLGDQAELTSKKTGKLGSAGVVVGSALADLAGGIAKTASNLASFGASAATGNAKLEDVFLAFKDLPIIGIVAQLFASLAKIQTENLEQFRSLTQSGINFGTGLNNLRETALNSKVSLEFFVQNLKQSADTLQFIGTSANQGAKNLKNINLEITRTGGFGEQLKNLGFSYEDLNKLTTSYARTVGGLNRQQQTDYKGVAEAAVAYGKELDLLARITGKSREAQQKELEEAMQESNFQAFLATLNPDEAKKLQSQVNEAMQVAGKGGAEIVKAQAMGIAVQGQQGKLLTALGGELAEKLRNQTDAAMNTSVSVEQFKSQTIRRVAELQTAAAEAYPRIAKPMQALALQGEAVAESIGPLAKNFTALKNAGAENLEERERQLQAEKAATDAAAATRNADLANALSMEANMKEFNAKMSQILSLLSGKLMPIMSRIVDELHGIANTLVNFAENLFTPEGRQKIIKDIVDGVTEIVAGTWTKLKAGPDEAALRQDQANWDKMKWYEKTESGLARGIEKIGSFLGLDMFANRGANSRIQAETEALRGRAFGSYGVTGKLFEDFGNGTNVTLHGQESVMTPSQLSSLMDGSAANNLKGLVEQLNSVNSQMLHTMKQVAEYTKRNVDATKALSGDAFA